MDSQTHYNPQQANPQPPTRIILEQAGLFGRWGARIAWIGLAICILIIVGLLSQQSGNASPHVDERYHSLSRLARDKVAIVSVDGTILHNDGFVKWQIDRVREDENVKALVVRVDSPGGTVTGSHYIYHHLRRLADERDLPIVVSMGGIAASGGYYVSMAVGDTPDSVYAEPTTWTGSIGVIIPHYDLSGLLAKLAIKDDSIASHRLKDILSPTKEMTEEERGILQTLVDESLKDFVEIIKSGRPKLTDEKITEIATGQIFTAKQALNHGLVDRLGFVEDAVDRSIELAGLDKDNVRVIKYARPSSLVGDLLFGPSAQSDPPDMAALLNLATPRAYYLCSLLPSMINAE